MARPAIIHKSASDLRVLPNLPDDAAAHEAVDRHARSALRDHIAFRFLDSEAIREISFGELARLTNRFGNVLRQLGIGKGQRLFVLTGRIPELYLTVLGSFKNSAVVSPLFSAFRPEPIATRLNLGASAGLVTTATRARRRTFPARSISATFWRKHRTNSTSSRSAPTIWHCCISPAAPPVHRRARCTCTRPS